METLRVASANTIVTTVGKVAVVCGLTWDVLQQRDAKSQAVELAELAKRRGSRDAAVLQTATGRSLVGFVPAGAPAQARKGFSAAAWLAASVENPLVYIEQVDTDRWWYVVVRPGEVDISSDRIGSGTDVAAALDDLLTEAVREAEWASTQVVLRGTAPPIRLIEQNVVTPVAGSLDTLLDRERASDPRIRIKRVVGGVSVLLLVAAIAIVGSLALGGAWFVMQVVRDRAELAAAQAAALAEQRSDAELKTLSHKRIADAVTAALAADTATAAPDAFMDACMASFMTAPTNAGGWRLADVQCTPTATIADSHWERRRGDLSDNATLAGSVHGWGGAPTFDISGSAATVALPTKALVARAALRSDQLPTQTVVSLNLGTWGQRQDHAAGLTTDIAAAAVKPIQYLEPRPGQGKNGFSPVPADKLYRIGALKITGRGGLAYAAVRTEVPYVSLTSIRLTTTPGMNLVWDLEGTYVLANH